MKVHIFKKAKESRKTSASLSFSRGMRDHCVIGKKRHPGLVEAGMPK